jgi:flagellar biosynthesis/type III secretory pathway protein FliH
MQHSVYSQVMQQLELHATGELKRMLRESLEPALTQVALDIAAQVADETAVQVQSIVANAVENEVARLREQIQTKRRERDAL